MKVNVLQVEQATFRSKLSRWSNWVDVAVFEHGRSSYLLQMSISRANKKKFRDIKLTKWGVPADRIGDLTQMEAE